MPRKPLDPGCTGTTECPLAGHVVTRTHSRGTTTAHAPLTDGQRRTLRELAEGTSTRPDSLTSVAQLHRDTLVDPRYAPGALEETVAVLITQMAQAQSIPGRVDWETFRLRVETGTAHGMDTALRVRASVDVIPARAS